MSIFSLINPNDASCYKFKRQNTVRLPLGLAYVAAGLRSNGHEVHVVDAAALRCDPAKAVELALEHWPDYVGITATTPIYEQAVEMCRELHDQSPGTIVVLGGPHVSALPESSLRHSDADYVFVGEGEESLPALVGGTPEPKVPGLVYWDGDTIKKSPPYRTRLTQPREKTFPPIDLDRCPIPARDIFDHSKYRDEARDVNSPQTTAMFSRGCPGRCAFCGAAHTIVRWRHLDNVLAELHQIQDMGVGNVFVMDDTFTNKRDRVLELCQRILTESISLNFGIQLRLDQIDREVCDALFAAGVRMVGPGIESGSERIMKRIGKGPHESKQHIKEKMALLKQYNWIVRCSFVFGMIGETEQDILDSIEFAKEIKADEYAFAILTPYPGSPLWDYAVAKGILNDKVDFNRFLHYHTVACNLSDVPTERLLELHEIAYREVPNRYKI
jgi:anaerobic magnesium-protoporphyrin IX monomethyl ester cyclase